MLTWDDEMPETFASARFREDFTDYTIRRDAEDALARQREAQQAEEDDSDPWEELKAVCPQCLTRGHIGYDNVCIDCNQANEHDAEDDEEDEEEDGECRRCGEPCVMQDNGLCRDCDATYARYED